MHLVNIWSNFIECMLADKQIVSCIRKDITGIPFIYINTVKGLSISEVLHLINSCSKSAMYRHKVTSKTSFVRMEEDQDQYVFRHRFFVPQEKMFCCGNLCNDCILLKKSPK